MGYNITPEEIEKMKAFLKEHPVDPQYEGLLMVISRWIR